jgi:hypothetical protein
MGLRRIKLWSIFDVVLAVTLTTQTWADLVISKPGQPPRLAKRDKACD